MKKNHSFIFAFLLRILFLVTLFALIWYLIIPNTSINYKKDYQAFSNRLNEKDLIMIQGETFKLELQKLNKRVKFSSMDIKVAPVTPLGTVIALRPGKTYITVKYENKELKCRVRVYKINKKKIKLKTKEKINLNIKGPGIIKSVKWSSNKPNIAKVNRFGTVKGVSKGKAVITGKINDKKINCLVIVE